MKKIVFVVFLLVLTLTPLFSNDANTKQCDGLSKKRFRIDQENRIDVKKPLNVFVNVCELIDRVKIEGVENNTIDVKADVRLHLKTNINNLTVDVKRKGDDIFIETNHYPYDVRLRYCDKKGGGEIEISLPRKNIKLFVFKGLKTEFVCKNIKVNTLKLKTKYKDINVKDSDFKKLSVKTFNGDVIVSNSNAKDFSVFGGFGEVFLENVQPENLYVSLLSGDFETFGLMELKKGVITTTFGDIRIDLKSFSSVFLKTISGDIDLGVINPQRVRFNCKTERGDFLFKYTRTKPPLPENGILKSGKGDYPEISVNSVSGDIILRELRN